MEFSRLYFCHWNPCKLKRSEQTTCLEKQLYLGIKGGVLRQVSLQLVICASIQQWDLINFSPGCHMADYDESTRITIIRLELTKVKRALLAALSAAWSLLRATEPWYRIPVAKDTTANTCKKEVNSVILDFLDIKGKCHFFGWIFQELSPKYQDMYMAHQKHAVESFIW